MSQFNDQAAKATVLDRGELAVELVVQDVAVARCADTGFLAWVVPPWESDYSDSSDMIFWSSWV
jgi:hypothetical protein